MGRGGVFLARVLIFADHFVPGFRAGGPIRSLASIVANEVQHHDVWVVTRDHDLGSAKRYGGLSEGWNSVLGARTLYVDTRSPRGVIDALRRVRSLQVDLVYFNSLFSPVFSIAPLIAYVPRGATTLLAPRGECAPQALALKAAKKRAASIALRRLLRRRGVAWHATSTEELCDINAWTGERTQHAVIRADPAPTPAPTPSDPELAAEFRVVGLSRIAPIKDVGRFVGIISRVPFPTSARYFGPMEDAKYWASLDDQIRALPQHVKFTYEGPIEPTAVPALFSSADALLFPTKGENFGHVVPEALAQGCPVVASDTTIWTDLLRASGGAAFDDDDDAVLTLRKLRESSREKRAEIRRGVWRGYVEWYERSLQSESLFSEALSLGNAGHE